MAGEGLSGWFTGGKMSGSELTGAESIGIGLSIAGAASSVINAFYAVDAMKYQAAAQESRLTFEMGQMGRANSLKEIASREMKQSGQEEAGEVGLKYRQAIGSSDARGGASGTQAGVGSRKEMSASMEWAKDTALTTVRKSTANKVAAIRSDIGTGQGQQALLGGQAAAARALKSSYGGTAKGMAGFTSLLGGAGQVMSTFSRTQSNYSGTGTKGPQ